MLLRAPFDPCFLATDHTRHEIIGLFHHFLLQSLEKLDLHYSKQQMYHLKHQRFHLLQQEEIPAQQIRHGLDYLLFAGYNGDRLPILVLL